MSGYPGKLYRPCLGCGGPVGRPGPGSRLRIRLLCDDCAEPNQERIAAGESWSRRELVTPKVEGQDHAA